MSRVAVVQAGSVPFDAEAGVTKATGLIAECARRGVTVAVFPEAFIGGYSRGLQWGAAMGSRTRDGRADFARYAEAAIELDGRHMAELAEASREHGVFLVIGVIEKLANTLYCTAVMLSPEHGLTNHHRKLMPTATERLVWGFGDGSTMETVQSLAGRLGDDTMIAGGSVIIDPLGQVLAGPVYGEETVLCADIDLTVKTESHLDFDPVGHYARPDIFHLEVNRTAQLPVTSRSTPEQPG